MRLSPRASKVIDRQDLKRIVRMFAYGAVVSRVLDYDPVTAYFSATPGGLAEMSVIALSLGIETAFVATHHVARFAIIVIGAAVVFRAARRWRNKEDPAPPAE